MSPSSPSSPSAQPARPEGLVRFDPVRWLRAVGRIEAVSFLMLLGVAMPLKYAAGWPGAVSVVGMLHGVLFIAFVGVWLLSLRRLPVRWALLSLAASVVPAGPFWTDPMLRRFEAGAGAGAGVSPKTASPDGAANK